MRLVVKHAGKSISIEVPDDATAQDVSAVLVAETGILARKQKLVHKGKVLTASLASAGVKDGSTLMLLASGGSSAATAGGIAAAAATGVAVAAKVVAEARKKETTTTATQDSSLIPESRVRAWTATGVVGLRGLGLLELPEALFVAARSSSTSSSSALLPPIALARAVDLEGNRLASLPEKFVEAAATANSKLSRLRLARNALAGPCALPRSLCRLSCLSEIVLDENPSLGPSLPVALFSLPKLARLSASRCGLREIPGAIGDAKGLSELVIPGNYLATLPLEIGECSELRRLDASSNEIAAIPEGSLGRCARLTVLRLANNRLSALPDDLFPGASSLHTLDVRGNEVTLEKLREAARGWSEFDQRRVKAADAKLAGRVDVAGGKGGGAFDATADAEDWIKW